MLAMDTTVEEEKLTIWILPYRIEHGMNIFPMMTEFQLGFLNKSQLSS